MVEQLQKMIINPVWGFNSKQTSTGGCVFQVRVLTSLFVTQTAISIWKIYLIFEPKLRHVL